jgi:hypothetical protein
MTLNSSFVVRVEKQPELSFGDIMNRIRTWLDHHKIEPISFVPVSNAARGVGFEIAFNSENEAHLFQAGIRIESYPTGRSAS